MCCITVYIWSLTVSGSEFSILMYRPEALTTATYNVNRENSASCDLDRFLCFSIILDPKIEKLSKCMFLPLLGDQIRSDYCHIQCQKGKNQHHVISIILCFSIFLDPQIKKLKNPSFCAIFSGISGLLVEALPSVGGNGKILRSWSMIR